MSLSDTALVTLIQAKSHLRLDTAGSESVFAEYVGMGDGANKTFTLDNDPIDGSLRLYVDGTLQTETTHFSISSTTITFVTAPANAKAVTASYDKTAAADTFASYDDDELETLIEAATQMAEDYTGRAFIQRSTTERHHGDGGEVLRLNKMPVDSITSVSYERVVGKTGDGSTTAWGLGYTPKSGTLTVYVDGVLQTVSTHYTLSGQTVTFVSAPADGTKVVFRFNVSLDIVDDYTEWLHIGRLKGSWEENYEYEVIYTAGYASTRAATQVLIPDAVTAVLMIVARLYENRVAGVTSQKIDGLGSWQYDRMGGEVAAKGMTNVALQLLGPMCVSVGLG